MIPHLLNITDLQAAEITKILETALAIKASKLDVSRVLAGRHLAILFEKPSTRTRVSLEVGIAQMGGASTFLNWNDIQLSRGEDLADTARVLSRYLDALIIRAKDHDILQGLKEYSSIPIINALTNRSHPLQILADFLTMEENSIPVASSKVCFMGDGNNNVCRSLAEGVSLMGGIMVICSPPEYSPAQLPKAGPGSVAIETDVEIATAGANVIYSDVWISMGDEEEAEKRKQILAPYQLNSAAMANAHPECIVLHCLPAMKGQEITEEVFESSNSRIFDQAENRLHAQKALLALMLQ